MDESNLSRGFVRLLWVKQSVEFYCSCLWFSGVGNARCAWPNLSIFEQLFFSCLFAYFSETFFFLIFAYFFLLFLSTALVQTTVYNKTKWGTQMKSNFHCVGIILTQIYLPAFTNRYAAAIWSMWRWRPRVILWRPIDSFYQCVRHISKKCSHKCQRTNMHLVSWTNLFKKTESLRRPHGIHFTYSIFPFYFSK